MTLLELVDDDFTAMLAGAATLRPSLRTPPGGVDDAAVVEHVRTLARRLHAAGRRESWGIVVDGEIVGMIGFHAAPSAAGEVELGYGIAASRRRRGHATAAVAEVVRRALSDPTILAIVAETGADNAASIAALERSGFVRESTRIDPDDGPLVRWRRSVYDNE